ncbi:MAG: BMC domain-containing protein [Defluviitaleaceae bacterium]|nr:BMC domain-containing protein [Defluviitaleaceae bacterium]
MESKQRIIQELVPGKQITLAHIIANPDAALLAGLSAGGDGGGNRAIGVFTITPPEGAIIIADIAIKSAGVRLLSIEHHNGSLLISGSVSEVEAAAAAILDYVNEKLGFEICNITKT